MADIRADKSEIIHYDNPEFPVMTRFNEIPWYCALYETSMHWHDDLEFIYVVKGSIIQHINGQDYILHKGEGMFINSNQVHDVDNNNEDVDLYCLIFKPTLLCTCRYTEEHYVIPITGADNIPFILLYENVDWQKAILDGIRDIVEMGYEGDKELSMVSELNRLWKVLYDNSGITRETKPVENIGLSIFKRMAEYIQTEYASQINLSDICKEGGVGKTKCTELFEKYVHMSPVEYTICYRLEVASHLLRETDRSISDIAYECGFSGASYFSESFKKRVGITPNEFRRRENSEDKRD